MSILDFATPRFHIMVSSPIAGLQQERRAIKDALEALSPHFRVWLSEEWGSDSNSPNDTCIELAKDCDCFILLMERRYGFIPEKQVISVTEMEFEAARADNSKKIKAYLKKLKSVELAQEEFIKRIRHFESGMIVPTFSARSELIKLVVSDVIAYYGSRDRFNAQFSQDYISPQPESAGEVVYLPQTDRALSAGSKKAVLVDKQREYFKKAVQKAKPAELAKRLISEFTPDKLEALSLIGQANVLARKDYLESLFPDIAWKGFIQQMHGRGILVSGR